MTYFADNLEHLRKASPELAQRMEQFHAQLGEPASLNGFKVEKSRSGLETAYYEGAGDKFHLHSSYDPQKEAEQFASTALLEHNGANFIIFLGLGLGHGVKELLWRLPDNYRVLIFEPHWDMFYLAFCHSDLGPLFNRPLTTITCDPTIQGAMFNYLNLFELAGFNGVRFISNPAFDKLPLAGAYDELAQRVRYEMLAVGGNTQTLMVMGEMQQMNVMLNFPHVLDNPPFKHLLGRFGGKPAIIVSAGPSLEKNMHLLRDAADRSVIIAVDTAVKPLLANGITPHIVVSGDPQEANYRHLKGVDLPETYLIVEPQCPVSTLAEWTGPKFICSFHDNMMRWVDRVLGDRGRVIVWGSVAVMAYDVAVKLGADPIVFIGQDLSFPGGRTYAGGTFFETEEKQEMTVAQLEQNGTPLIEMEDIHGEIVKTNRQMYAYFNFLKNRFLDPEAANRTIINATEGGILKGEKIKVMPLNEVIDRYMTQGFDTLALLEEAHRGGHGINYANLMHELDTLIAALREGHENCVRGLEAVQSALALLQQQDESSPAWRRDLLKQYQRFERSRKAVGRSQEASKLVEMANQAGIFAFAQGLQHTSLPLLAEGSDGPTSQAIASSAYHHHTLFVSTRDALERMLPLMEAARRGARDRSMQRRERGAAAKSA